MPFPRTPRDARGLRPAQEWTGGFELLWNDSFDRLDEDVPDRKPEARKTHGHSSFASA